VLVCLLIPIELIHLSNT